jgi:hypothetical protein
MKPRSLPPLVQSRARIGGSAPLHLQTRTQTLVKPRSVLVMPALPIDAELDAFLEGDLAQTTTVRRPAFKGPDFDEPTMPWARPSMPISPTKSRASRMFRGFALALAAGLVLTVAIVRPELRNAALIQNAQARFFASAHLGSPACRVQVDVNTRTLRTEVHTEIVTRANITQVLPVHRTATPKAAKVGTTTSAARAAAAVPSEPRAATAQVHVQPQTTAPQAPRIAAPAEDVSQSQKIAAAAKQAIGNSL